MLEPYPWGKSPTSIEFPILYRDHENSGESSKILIFKKIAHSIRPC